MKRFFGTELVIILIVVVVGGGIGWLRHRVLGPADESRAVVSTFAVEGMDCENCETGVRTKLMALDGVFEVTPSFEASSAAVTYDPERISPETIAETISATGFAARWLEDQQADGSS